MGWNGDAPPVKSTRQLQWEHCLPEAIRRAHARVDKVALDWRPEVDAELDVALLALDDLLNGRVHACEIVHPGRTVTFY